MPAAGLKGAPTSQGGPLPSYIAGKSGSRGPVVAFQLRCFLCHGEDCMRSFFLLC